MLNPGHAQLWWWTLPAELAEVDSAARSRWVWVRVRALLASHAEVGDSELEIRRSANGKPEAPQLPCAFSLAHDDAVAVLPIGAVGQLGVDVMSDRGFDNPQRLARRLLTPPELALWLVRPKAQQLQQLRARFCATEAVVKALDWRLWPALGGIHFVRQGRVARVPLKRAQLHLVDGRRGDASFALASDVGHGSGAEHVPHGDRAAWRVSRICAPGTAWYGVYLHVASGNPLSDCVASPSRAATRGKGNAASAAGRPLLGGPRPGRASCPDCP